MSVTGRRAGRLQVDALTSRTMCAASEDLLDGDDVACSRSSA